MRKLRFESLEVDVKIVLRELTDQELLQEIDRRELSDDVAVRPEQIDLTAAIDEFHWKNPLEALRRIEIADPRLDGLGDAVVRHFGARP